MNAPNSPIGHFIGFLAAALVGLSASTVSARDTNPPDAWPEWLQKAMATESRKLKSKKIAFGDGFLQSRLAGKPMGAVQPIDGGWYVSNNIGTPSPLECWVFSTTIDPATMASNIADASIQAAENQLGPVGTRSVHFVDMGAIEGAPFLALEWLYTVGEAPNVNVGYAKVRIATIDEVTLACGHNYLGYRETFAKAFDEFVLSAVIDGDRPSPDYEEIIVHRIGEQPIGVSHASYKIDEDGDTEIKMVESMLIPVDGSSLNISDKWHASFARPDGTLINQVTAKSENGVLTMNLSLDDQGGGTWLVSGTFQGKEIAEEIDAAAQPVSEIGQMHAVKRLLADGERNEVILDAWIPDVDPTTFLKAGVELDSDRRQDGYATLTLGPMAMAAQFDTTGSLVSARLQAGAAEMFVDRIWNQGTPP